MDGTSKTLSTPFGTFLREVSAEFASTRASCFPSNSLPAAEWRKLFKPVVPMEGESLRSLVARACKLNHLPNSWGLLQYVGLPNRSRVRVAEDSNIDPAELAHAIGVDDKEVRTRRYEALGRGHGSFFGLDVNYAAIETRIRRFSPAALKANGFHRAIWELRDIPFCLNSWDMLHDRCWCEKDGTVQGWTRTATSVSECDRCGDSLAEFAPIPVPIDMRPALSVLSALVDPVPATRVAAAELLPKGLREVDRSILFALVARIARVIDPEAATHSIEEPRLRLRGLWHACNALIHWPNGIHGISWSKEHSSNTVKEIIRRWNAPKAIAASNLASPRDANPPENERSAGRIVGIGPAPRISPSSLRRSC